MRTDEDLHTRARTRTLLAVAAFTGLALRGPRNLNEAEVQIRRRRPPPRIAPPDATTFAGYPDPLPKPAGATGGVEVVETLLRPKAGQHR
jgi:hypothetical protein